MTAYHTEMISTDQEQNEVVSAVSSITSTVPKQAKLSIRDRLLKSQLISCIAGSIILFGSFGIRQAIGVFLIPITQDTGWDRSTFSSAAGTFQLFWGFSQPFLVYLAERKFGFGKSIFMACLVYGVGLLIVYASRASSALFLVAYGIFVGSASGGNSFPVVLAAIGRRFPQKSNQQAKAFGIVSSFGSLGQCVFLPVSRAMIAALGWRLPFIIFGMRPLVTFFIISFL
jgi:MFS family permease